MALCRAVVICKNQISKLCTSIKQGNHMALCRAVVICKNQISVADPGGGQGGHGPPPPLSQIRTISYAPLSTF